jgi:hypothetical protein
MLVSQASADRPPPEVHRSRACNEAASLRYSALSFGEFAEIHFWDGSGARKMLLNVSIPPVCQFAEPAAGIIKLPRKSGTLRRCSLRIGGYFTAENFSPAHAKTRQIPAPDDAEIAGICGLLMICPGGFAMLRLLVSTGFSE